MEHNWQPGLRGKTPVLECRNDNDCVLIWWPDREKPKKQCPVLPRTDR